MVQDIPPLVNDDFIKELILNQLDEGNFSKDQLSIILTTFALFQNIDKPSSAISDLMYQLLKPANG